MDRAPFERIASIDVMRGVGILLMAVGNFAMDVRWVPSSLKHAPDIGFTIADLVAPMFILSIGLTVGPSMRRRRAAFGAAAARVHLVKRALALVGIGAVISIGQSIVRPLPGVDLRWGVLQCIGTSTLLLLPCVFLPMQWRLVVGAAMLVGYQVLLDRYWLRDVLQASHNGIWGSLSWGGMLVLASVVGDAFHGIASHLRRLALLVGSGATCVTLALVLATWQPISKHRASATYMLLSLGLCLLVFALADAAMEPRSQRWPWLQAIGRNPLALYLANLLLLSLFTLPTVDVWHVGAPVWLSLLQVATIVAVNIALARGLERRDLVLRL